MTDQSIALGQPAVTASPRRLVLYRHRIVAHTELPAVIGATFGELYAHIGTAGVAPAGPPFVIYHENFEPGVRWEIDICAPVSAPISAPPEFEFMEMPAGRVVSLMHVGPYQQLGVAYEQIQTFIKDHGLTIAGPPRECYFSEPDVPPERVQTLIEWPVV